MEKNLEDSLDTSNFNECHEEERELPIKGIGTLTVRYTLKMENGKFTARVGITNGKMAKLYCNGERVAGIPAITDERILNALGALPAYITKNIPELE